MAPSLPVLFTAQAAGQDLAAYAEQSRSQWEQALAEHGAVLFRGFAVEDAARFGSIARSTFLEAVSYVYRSTPRTELGQGVYTATEYPPPLTIPQHSENAFAREWPLRLCFYCQTPPQTGGETPLSDNRETTARIPSSIRQRFEARHIMYVRNYGEGVDLPWQVVFQTSERQQVEAFCAERGIEVEWRGGDRLRTRQVLPALAVHPVTGEQFWFNQAHLFHPSSHDPETYEALTSLFEPEDLPRTALFGDGSPIPLEDLEAIRQAFQPVSTFPWQQGDVLLVDNMRIAHGRRPFTGPRKVLVTMGNLHRGPAAGLSSARPVSRSA